MIKLETERLGCTNVFGEVIVGYGIEEEYRRNRRGQFVTLTFLQRHLVCCTFLYCLLLHNLSIKPYLTRLFIFVNLTSL